eukprot:5003181-Amphidinium_carterae.2
MATPTGGPQDSPGGGYGEFGRTCLVNRALPKVLLRNERPMSRAPDLVVVLHAPITPTQTRPQIQ